MHVHQELFRESMGCTSKNVHCTTRQQTTSSSMCCGLMDPHFPLQSLATGPALFENQNGGGGSVEASSLILPSTLGKQIGFSDGAPGRKGHARTYRELHSLWTSTLEARGGGRAE